jgi:hypothetical protein
VRAVVVVVRVVAGLAVAARLVRFTVFVATDLVGVAVSVEVGSVVVAVLSVAGGVVSVVTGAGSMVVAGGGSTVTGCASWARSGVEESARAAAIAGRALARA